MKNVTYFNAGAGSGKTYTLTHLLADQIREGVKPSEVILTTFTTKAADDLRQRARAVLYEQGLTQEAALLDQAIIGTVHSIGQQFITKFWYLLDLSPNMNVMDEDATNFYINRSLAELPTAQDIEMFHQFREAFNMEKMREDGNHGTIPDEDFWKGWLQEVINKATWYRVDDFEESCRYSIERLREIYQPVEGTIKPKEDYMPVIRALEEVDSGDERNAAQERLARLKELSRKHTWGFTDYESLAKAIAAAPKTKVAKLLPDRDNLIAELTDVWHSQQVFDMLSQVVERIFAIAQRWKQQYSDYKAERRILDFNDMERYFVRLLQHPECVQEIRGRYRVLMVDEFQDSSPVQVDIFNRLSEMVDESYWCGDSKQAIFRFRGADTDLTEAVVSMIESEDPKRVKPLPKSYRSQPAIVNHCNAMFTKVFEGKLPAEKVTLIPNRKKEIDGPNLLHWTTSFTKKEDALGDQLATDIQRFAEMYDIPFNKIAVLGRTNNDLNIVSAALDRAGIPVNHITGELANRMEIELMSAILSLVVDANNPHGRARVAFLSTRGFTLEEMIESRMAEREEYARYLQEVENTPEGDPDSERPASWLADNPLIARILHRRTQWVNQPLPSMIETIMVGLNLRSVFKSWDSRWRQREDNIYQLVALATRYENYCRTMAFGVSINGFINWLRTFESQSKGDSQGVVLSTYHRAKGLEWENVILVSLDHDPAKESNIVKREVFGVHEIRQEQPTRDCLFPKMLISLLPNVFPGMRSLPDDLNQVVTGSQTYTDAQRQAIEEAARLMYVGMTRARDRLITYSHARGRGGDPMVAFTRLGVNTSIDPDALQGDIFSTGFSVAINNWPQRELSEEYDTEEDETPEIRDIDTLSIEQVEHHPRYISPSTIKVDMSAGANLVNKSGKRIILHGHPEMNLVGDCIHNSYAAFTGDLAHDLEVFTSIRHGFGFDQVIPNSKAVVDAYQWLIQWLKEGYGEASGIHHEVPFYNTNGGAIVRGSMDFVYETPEGCVLVDFKTFPGKEDDVTDPNSRHFAGKYGMQFVCYEEALKASGRTVLGSYVYYPVSGLLVKIGATREFNPPHPETVFHVFGIDGIELEKLWSRVCELNSEDEFSGEIAVTNVDTDDDKRRELEIALRYASTQGVNLTLFQGKDSHLHLELPMWGSVGDARLTFSILSAIVEQYPDCEIYFNNDSEGQVQLDQTTLDYLVETRMANMFYILSESTDGLHLALQGIHKTFFPYSAEDFPEMTEEELVYKAMDEFVLSQWNFEDIYAASEAHITEPDGEEYTARIFANTEDTFMGASQRVILFDSIRKKMKIIPLADFRERAKNQPWYEPVDAMQYVLRKMPHADSRALYASFPHPEINS